MEQLLKFEEYQNLGGTASADDFDKLERDAEDLINPLTNNFYVLHSIDTDEDTYRVNCFKKALELQINYTNSIGASTPYEMAEKDIKSISVDGTTVSTGSSPVGDSVTTGGVYRTAIDQLYMAGLLFRGIPSC